MGGKSEYTASPLALFEWSTPQAGFRWVGARADRVVRPRPGVLEHTRGGQAFLVWNNERDEWQTRTVPLRDDSVLFKRFSELDPGRPDSILAFANRNGWLGIGRREGERMLVPAPQPSNRLVEGEGLAEWAEEILSVRQTVHLIEAATNDDKQHLSRLLTVRNGHAVYRRSEPVTTREVARKIASKVDWLDAQRVRAFPPTAFAFGIDKRVEIRGEGGLADYLEDGDFVTAAKFVAQRMVNDALDRHTRARCVYDPEKGSQRLHVYPWNLIGAIWIQTAEMLQGDRKYHRCESCGQLFGTTPGALTVSVRRADSKYCKDRCRFKAQADRKAKARRLRAEGMAPSKIAKELGSDTRTVRGWLGLGT